MPTYQYRCTECKYEFEEFQSITEDPIEVCPSCNGKVHRLISGGAGFLLKGTGFYQTDHRSKAYLDSARKEKSASSTASSSSSHSKSSKPSSGSSPKSSDKKSSSSGS
ncbi:MAG: hypothetical protein DRP45_00020 [Candidatus Zixiibacteriota bacterium]|nr:MAG: hypothetical protein DRP45_00020 [candidate division Zixibacteria bacterium]